MRIFLTGATGYIGNAVALNLRKHGHDVAALVRPESETRSLRDAGVVLIAGDLSALSSLEFNEYDAIVHTAVAKKNAVALDKGAVEVFTKSGRPFLYTSGVWILGNTTNANESTRVNPLPIVAFRSAHETLVLESGGAALRPGCVYGGRQSMFADWFTSVKEGAPIRIVGDGKNRWACVSLEDLADCYLRAIEQGATGVLHATDDTHSTLNDLARALSKDAKIEHVPVDREKLGPFADALLVDQVILSDATRRKLGWKPKQTFASASRELDQ
jgi:nucleoside-diphosphate-sugar epimerase